MNTIALLILGYVLIVASICLYILITGKRILLSRKEQIEICEECYFEGQRDALINRTCIKLRPDGTWEWSRSPWDDKSAPIFKPGPEYNNPERVYTDNEERMLE